MIKKTIIAAIILFVAYNVLLAYVHPLIGPGQNQWQKNRILIEDYVDNYQGTQAVIVGTSLSARLYPSLLPHGYYNLALAGESVLDGLNIVAQCAKKPKYLIVETNIYYKDPDKDLSKGIFDPLMLLLRKWVPSFREENQPANLLPPLFGGGKKGENANQSKMDTGIQNTLLKQKIADNQLVPDRALIAKNLRLLKQYIAKFQSEGTKVILYEMPVNCKLYNTPRYIIPQNILINAFPVSQYQWMSNADCAAYDYADGEHLAFQSSVKFAAWFVGELHRVGVGG